jgi:hypothetical protein
MPWNACDLQAETDEIHLGQRPVPASRQPRRSRNGTTSNSPWARLNPAVSKSMRRALRRSAARRPSNEDSQRASPLRGSTWSVVSR